MMTTKDTTTNVRSPGSIGDPGDYTARGDE